MTVSVNEVVPPAAVAGAGLPFTVIVSGVLIGVALVMVMVSMSVAPVVTGVTVGVAKPHETPAGSGVAHDRVTGCARPFTKVAVIMFVPVVLGLAMLTLPEFESE